jgi:16S rRNA (adenine1518-N6/adenine1519-N6)-dimethyltransferase
VHGHASPPHPPGAVSSTPSDPTALPAHPAARLRALGLHARKSLSQSFLADPGVARAAVDAAEIQPHETVLEPGPGLGVLTELLVRCALRVVAVELDRDLARVLSHALSAPNLEVIQGDILHLDPAEHDLTDYVLVSNLPYQISSAVLTRFLLDVSPPRRMVLMLQREVADRLMAQPGSMSYLGVQAQLLTRVRLIRHVPSGAFYPRPKVESSLVRLDLLAQPAVDVLDVRAFLALVRGGFTQPRKQLRNSLAQGLAREPAEAARLIAAAALAPTLRAQELSLDDWAQLFAAYTASIAS